MEEMMTGGNMGGAIRVGDTVRRAAAEWNPTVQRLLGHLRDRGLTWVPHPLGTDEYGRDTVSYLPGVVPQYPLPAWVWSREVLIDAGAHLAHLHQASLGFDVSGAVWQSAVRQPAEVICHNDFAPYNMVFTDGRLSGCHRLGHGLARPPVVGRGVPRLPAGAVGGPEQRRRH
ncbi:hypothetical protein ACIP95_03400 [Micromonospora parva]|uniref:Aminoglycoside phosphotransferase domain-containing protein n=1 Tax=Micromonospora parva TaxID=1464048 RepID=A0ABW6VWQ4_9ACTN